MKNFIVNELPGVSSTLETKVTVLHEVMGMQVVEAQVELEGNKVASCEMKIFLSEES